MSKYEDFVIMRTYGFLVILGFIQFVFCVHDLNITHDCISACPVELFRRKRAYPEYTRWRDSQETTNEFLVKVLDEDFTTSHTKAIVAVNILPATKRTDKIIIGGANIPQPTTLRSTTSEARDYTRFVPPTTKPGHDPNTHIAPLTHTTIGNPIIQSLQPQGYHSQRDDSPPASPQFIARTPLLVPRQYAPIEPVAFNRRTSVAPLTPPTVTMFNAYTLPSRTTPETPPDRSKVIDDFHKIQLFEDEVLNPDDVTRTTYSIPERTTSFEFTSASDIDDEFGPTTTKFEESGRRHEEMKKINEKYSESSYNMMFYNEDETTSTKKDDQEVLDNEYDNKIAAVDTPETDYSDSPVIFEGNESKEVAGDTELQNDLDQYVSDNVTGNAIPKGIIGIPGIEIATIKTAHEKQRDKRRPFCSLLKLRQLDFNSPRTLPEIMNQLKTWAEDSPVAKWVDITDSNYTTMENPIYMMMVDDPSSGQIVTAKQTVMIVAGIQGRDHHAVAAAMYVLYQLIERSESHADLLTKYRFWIIPVFNPDGYDYSMTFPQRREWSKNLRQHWDTCKGRESCKACETHGLRCTIQPCYGVNLDRNFEYQWIPADELRAEHPCGSLYAGTRQLSEAETRALTHFLHEQRTPLFTFIAFKEGDVLGVMYPYSHTKKKRAFDHVFRQRASRAASAASSISNRPYMSGQTSEFLPLYAGGIEDWVDGHLGIDNTYTIMMFRPTDLYNTKLITERVVHETYAAMDTLLLQSLEPLGPAPAVTMTRAGYCERILPKRLLYIIHVYLMLLLNG